jgi:hypothetical protein
MLGVNFVKIIRHENVIFVGVVGCSGVDGIGWLFYSTRSHTGGFLQSVIVGFLTGFCEVFIESSLAIGRAGYYDARLGRRFFYENARMHLFYI